MAKAKADKKAKTEKVEEVIETILPQEDVVEEIQQEPEITEDQIKKDIQNLLDEMRADNEPYVAKVEKALIQKDFSLRVPIKGHRTSSSIIAFKAGKTVTDEYLVQFLKQLDKPVTFFFE